MSPTLRFVFAVAFTILLSGYAFHIQVESANLIFLSFVARFVRFDVLHNKRNFEPFSKHTILSILFFDDFPDVQIIPFHQEFPSWCFNLYNLSFIVFFYFFFGVFPIRLYNSQIFPRPSRANSQQTLRFFFPLFFTVFPLVFLDGFLLDVRGTDFFFSRD